MLRLLPGESGAGTVLELGGGGRKCSPSLLKTHRGGSEGSYRETHSHSNQLSAVRGLQGRERQTGWHGDRKDGDVRSPTGVAISQEKQGQKHCDK